MNNIDDDEIVLTPGEHKKRGAVPAGLWDAVVQDMVPRVSGKGNAYYELIFEIAEGEYTGDQTEQWAGARVWCKKPWMLDELIATVHLQPEADGKVHTRRSELLGWPIVLELVATQYLDKEQRMQVGNEVMHIYDPEAVPGGGPVANVPAGQADNAELPF